VCPTSLLQSLILLPVATNLVENPDPMILCPQPISSAVYC
jgi:hypothetical protein